MSATTKSNALLVKTDPQESAPPHLGNTWTRRVRVHWPEYAMEGALLGAFMVSACLTGVLLEHPSSPVRIAITVPSIRRALAGLAMGVTAVAIFYSPWGKQSGAHINPGVTLTFLWLGKISRVDAIFYIASQFFGSVVAVALVSVTLRGALSHRAVNFVATVPGERGALVAFLAELMISFLLMSVVLYAISHARLHRFAGLLAASLVALYISFESPLSGMSMNAARTFGSALSAHLWTAYWVYALAPLCGMLAAAALHLALRRERSVQCAKFHHANEKRCIHCGANGGHHRG